SWPQEFETIWKGMFSEPEQARAEIAKVLTDPAFRKRLLENFFDKAFSFPNTTTLQAYVRGSEQQLVAERAIRAALIASMSEKEAKDFLKKYFVDPAVAIRDGSDETAGAKEKLYDRMLRLGSLAANDLYNLKQSLAQRATFAEFFGLKETACFF
ncbi:MAG: hypothetical protein KDD51_15270, partial [Bdellovibrionales bacterium]|nr:hypothetical protein [Bdellovibrionales bacterium]